MAFRFRDIRAGKTQGAPASMLARTTFRAPSTKPLQPGVRPRWAAAQQQMANDLLRQQPLRSRRRRLTRKPRVGRWP